MNLILSTICCLMSIMQILNIKLKTLEGNISPRYLHNANGKDILRILNLAEIKFDNKSHNKYEEADILKRKSNLLFILNFIKLLSSEKF